MVLIQPVEKTSPKPNEASKPQSLSPKLVFPKTLDPKAPQPETPPEPTAPNLKLRGAQGLLLQPESAGLLVESAGLAL